MASLTTADVRAYVTQRQADKAANGTINRELSALKRMFTLACQGGKLLVAPHIPMLQEDNVRRGFFEREQFEAVRRRLPAEVQPVVTFAYLTGWRINSEVLTMQWHQIDLHAASFGWIPEPPRTGKGTRSLRMLPELRDLLEEQRAATTVRSARRASSCRGCFTAAVARSVSIVAPGCARARTRVVLAASRTTSGAPPFATLCVPACLSAWP